MGHVVVFAPSPVVSVTIEEQHGEPEIHVHAGGQGIWQARMLRALGAEVTLCSVVAGESGDLLRHLISQEGIELLAVDGRAHNGTYIHDRRGGDRETLAETSGDQISRHDLDELYGLTLKAGMDAGTVILSGAVHEDIVPTGVYRRLASDLNAVGCHVIADLSGERLSMALAGGLTVVKVAHDELEADGRAPSTDVAALVGAMRQLVAEGATHAVVTRADQSTLLLSNDDGIDSPGLHHLAQVAQVAQVAQTTVTEKDEGADDYVRLAVAPPPGQPRPGSDAALLADGYATLAALRSVAKGPTLPLDDLESRIRPAR